ncbi:uncharacterized protein LOC110378886 isoform X2 [Helicoverpa armigera]|uniref:Pleiotrophin/Midkine C-terminal domain-containing protein n=2 Tax=Helicoverpa TaxID=7112 RepID=A0A2W1BJJ7_HELAM|nr:uncharacterized protein LOC110378886 isoform X2 [Helicoverpa armigera]PZC75219.1 hypothetical protein B5X24_HaOG206574 [Helicoverpa armigera]
MRTGLTTECIGGPGCKSPRGRSIGRRPACPRSRPAPPRHSQLALRASRTPPHRAARSHSRYQVMEAKYVWRLVAGLILLSAVIVSAEGEVWEESEHEVLIRSERGAKNRETCRYVRGAWSECDSKTNFRSRKLTLKKGDPASCESIKTIQKKCKKACRYEKSSWSECSPNGEMSRTDMLKANSDSSCDQSRRITKKCNKNKQVKTSKDKGRRNRQ